VHLGPGTRALVMGSSRGIGRAVAERAAARGATVGLVARTSREVEALADALPGEHVVLGATDVGDRAAAEAAIERFGRVDLLVACVNVLGVLHAVSATLPGLTGQGSGHVVVVTCAQRRTDPVAAATAAAQAAFAHTLHEELRFSGVGVTTVHVGEEQAAHRVADRLLRAVERDEHEVFCPPSLRVRTALPSRRG